jgi:hypothetical protein
MIITRLNIIAGSAINYHLSHHWPLLPPNCVLEVKYGPHIYHIKALNGKIVDIQAPDAPQGIDAANIQAVVDYIEPNIYNWPNEAQ